MTPNHTADADLLKRVTSGDEGVSRDVVPTCDSMVGARRLAAVLCVLALTNLMSCTSADTDATPPATGAQSSQSQSTFESDRHSYRLELPAGWVVAEYGGTWTSLTQFTPGAEVPGEDVVSLPDGGAFLVANSMAIPDGMRPADWLAELDRRVSSGLGPDGSQTPRAAVIAGEKATVLQHRREGMTVVGRSLTHAGRGYYFTSAFPTGDTTTAAELDRIVSSIRFADQ